MFCDITLNTPFFPFMFASPANLTFSLLDSGVTYSDMHSSTNRKLFHAFVYV